MSSTAISPAKLLCFDVYGTLIDWETGIYTAAQPLLSQVSSGAPTRAEFMRDYMAVENAQQSLTPSLRYPELLAKVYISLAGQYKVPAPPVEESAAFGHSVGSWAAFPDSPAALAELKKHFKLVVLSNVDQESFAESVKKLGGDGTFDAVYTAEDIGCYKPALTGFERVIKEAKENWGVEKAEFRVVAQSLYHDHVPAKRLGLRSVWIDRRGANMGKRPEEVGEIYDFRFETLGELAEKVRTEGFAI
jgi:2-haloalkanoic acid dehalogenase type II